MGGADGLRSSGLYTRAFVGSPEFTIAYLSLLATISVTPVLALLCGHHLWAGRLLHACVNGGLALGIGGVAVYKLGTSLAAGHRRYGPAA